MPQTPVSVASRSRLLRRTPVPATTRLLRSHNTPRPEPSSFEDKTSTTDSHHRRFTRSYAGTPLTTTDTSSGRMAVENEETPITKRIRQVLRGNIPSHNTPPASRNLKRRYDDRETIVNDQEEFELVFSDVESRRMPMHRSNRLPQTPKLRKTVVATKFKEKENEVSNSLVWKYFKTETVVNKSRGRNRAGSYPMVCSTSSFPNKHHNLMFPLLKRLFHRPIWIYRMLTTWCREIIALL